jgi:hypothetical protein
MSQRILVACLVIAWTIVSCPLVFAQDASFVHREQDIGFSAFAAFGGTVDTDFGKLTKETGVVIHAFGDFYLVDKLAMGVYANLGPSITVSESKETATMYEFGVSIKPRFVIRGGGVAVKPGLEIGYRVVSGKVFSNDVRALALNGSVELQINTHSGVIPFLVVGIYSQPAGGNGDTNVTFAPLFYAGIGVSF